MADIWIRKSGKAGRITLTRPQALNALSYQMCLDIEAVLDAWRDDDEVALVILDAEGERAFCAGGDIRQIYETGRTGDFGYGRRFWADEYRMNAKIADYPKPIVALTQGFNMGGGIGLSGHSSHRVVCETSQLAMPETGIGLLPDVGGTLLLARAPGHLGEYLGLTGARMGPADAIHAGFADFYIPREFWLDLVAVLEESGDTSALGKLAEVPPEGNLAARQPEIDPLFSGPRTEIIAALKAAGTDFAAETLKTLRRVSPLSVACTLEAVRRSREANTIRAALELEYRFTYRSAELGDLLEGVRAAIIDKDKSPRWQHARLEDVTDEDVARMLAPLGENALDLET